MFIFLLMFLLWIQHLVISKCIITKNWWSNIEKTKVTTVYMFLYVLYKEQLVCFVYDEGGGLNLWASIEHDVLI